LNGDECGDKFEDGLKSILSTFIIDCCYKIKKPDGSEVVFNLENICKVLEKGDSALFKSAEIVGPLRVLNLMKLKHLRKEFLSYVKTVLETPYKIENQKITDIQNRVVHEGAWLQFMSILKYWMEDTSTSFEKTDVFIEKSVKASFDVVYNVPIESILDFGKFIWKERFGNFNSKK
jgi:hypothetical protein